MNGTCDLARRDCERDAVYDLTLTPPDDEFSPLERQSCDRHLPWWRREFVTERDYEMDVVERDA